MVVDFFSLTILVLIVESHWTTEKADSKPVVENQENNTSCSPGEPFEVVNECHPCSAFEIASESVGVCVHARFKEVIKCKSGETLIRR